MGAAFDDQLINDVATVVSTEARAFNNDGRAGLDFWTVSQIYCAAISSLKVVAKHQPVQRPKMGSRTRWDIASHSDDSSNMI